MKRYDDVNVIKAYACLAVFGSHWFGTFGSWGSNKVNALMEVGPLPLFRYGTFGVSLFLMISGMLIADKVYSGRFTSWSSEILRRYLKLTCPLTVTFLLAYFLYRGGLFYTARVAPRLENEWLTNFYQYLPGGLKVLRYAWFDTIFKGDSTYYGPSWMLTYTFMGSILTLVLSSALREVGKRAKILILAGVAAVLIGMDSFYICLILGNGICLLMRVVEKSMEEASAGQKENVLRNGERKTETEDRKRSSDGEKNFDENRLKVSKKWILRRNYGIFGALLWLFSIWFVRKSFWIGTALAAHGFQGALGNMAFYGHIAAFLMIFGFRLFWLGGLETWLPGILKKIVLWIGEYSMGIFLTHWLVIASFSCWFYGIYSEAGEKLAIGLNLVLSCILIGICSKVYVWLVEGKIFPCVWKCAKNILKEN